MARNQGPPTPEDDAQPFYRSGKNDARQSSARKDIDETELPPLDSGMLDLDIEEQSPFLRAQKRVQVRRSALPKKTATRMRWALVVVTIAGALGLMVFGAYEYGTRSERFRIESSDNIEVVGGQHVSRDQVMHIMSPDISRNIFFVPLEERKQQLEEIPWVESATVMRLLPNRIKIELKERTPVAFVQLGSKIELIDASGVVMNEAPGERSNYSFPVIVGMQETDPLSVRAARMHIYMKLVDALDSGGLNYTKNLSEVNLSDPEDVKVTVADPAGAVLVHLGSSNFLERYKVYVAHVQEWRQQFPRLDSVDLRYDGQVVVNPDIQGEIPATAPKESARVKKQQRAMPHKQKRH